MGGRSDGKEDAGGADEQGQGDGQEKGGAGRVRGAEKIPVFNHAHQHPLVVFKGGVVVIKLHLLNTGIGGIGKIAVIHQGEAVLPDRLAGGENAVAAGIQIGIQRAGRHNRNILVRIRLADRQHVGHVGLF